MSLRLPAFGPGSRGFRAKMPLKTLLLLALVLGLGLACWPSAARADKIPVVVGIAPMKYFVDRIGGDQVETTVMVPAGADAHTYEPKPSQMRAVANASLYFAVGLEFEKAWVPRFQAANPRLKVVETDSHIRKQPMPAHDDGDEPAGRQGENEDDPHVWTSPALVKYIAEYIVETLSDMDPEHAATYRHNDADFLRELDMLNAEIRGIFAHVPRSKRKFLVFHPSWGYFAKAYGLTQIPVEVAGKEPGPKMLAGVIAQAKRENIKVVFVQPQFSTKSAQTIAEAIGGQVAVADPLAADWADNLRQVAKTFRQALR